MRNNKPNISNVFFQYVKASGLFSLQLFFVLIPFAFLWIISFFMIFVAVEETQWFLSFTQNMIAIFENSSIITFLKTQKIPTIATILSISIICIAFMKKIWHFLRGTEPKPATFQNSIWISIITIFVNIIALVVSYNANDITITNSILFFCIFIGINIGATSALYFYYKIKQKLTNDSYDDTPH